MRRARETAEGIASVTGLTVRYDARLRERLNWDGSMPFQAFGDLRAKTMRDRDWIGWRGPRGFRSLQPHPAHRHQHGACTAPTQHWDEPHQRTHHESARHGLAAVRHGLKGTL
jgi:hypothetical protein